MDKEERFKSYFGEVAFIALEQVPSNRRVISVLQDTNAFGQDYVEVVTELVESDDAQGRTLKDK